MKIKNCDIEIKQADITELKIDAIVNPANNRLIMGGGVAGAIKKKGGKEIEEEAIEKGTIEVGEAIFTSAGKLPCRFVIHAATMGMDFKTDEFRIRNACKNALELAEKLNIKSIAFPALGCGVGGFPYEAAGKIMTQVVFKHLMERDSKIEKIIFCLYDKEGYEIFKKVVKETIENIERKFCNNPLITVDAIIEKEEGVVLVRRKNPPFGWALPGGFVDYGESLEEAVRREVKEETGLVVKNLVQFHTYSEPGRDPRFHTVSTVYIVQAEGNPQANTDALEVKTFKFKDLEKVDFAFDHKKIIQDYLEKYKKVSC
ncbi:MAG: macro domain-containing protein [Candidatus Omnitrophota bacterium]